MDNKATDFESEANKCLSQLSRTVRDYPKASNNGQKIRDEGHCHGKCCDKRR